MAISDFVILNQIFLGLKNICRWKKLAKYSVKENHKRISSAKFDWATSIGASSWK
jgi:hypothetical protein